LILGRFSVLRQARRHGKDQGQKHYGQTAQSA
jgi:hypothetical protein